jgi:hypothetical protein
MPAIPHGRWSFRIGIALGAVLVAISVATAQEELPTTENETQQRPEHLVVLRLSAAMLNSLINKEIDHPASIQDIVLGTPVTGVARVIGQPRVQLVPSFDQAQFNVVITGTVYSRTVGRNGPAIIHGRSITHFTATKQIVFKPGEGFYALPPQVSAQAQTFTDGVQSTRGGIIGRFVQRRAARELAGQQRQLTAIARDRATRRIAAAFDRHMGERLTRLNRAVELRAMLAGVGQRAANLRVVTCTTPHYVEIASAANDRTSPIVLPVLGSASEMGAPIEIWIHGSVVPEQIGLAAKTLFTNPEQSALLHAISLLPGTFGTEATAAISALVGENRIAVRSVGDWLVVEINTQPVIKNVVAARTFRR